jgi:hypothetical protein
MVTSLCCDIFFPLHVRKLNFLLKDLIVVMQFLPFVKVKVKQSLYTPWRRLGGEEV